MPKLLRYNMVNFQMIIMSVIVSVWIREVHSMDCSELCRVPELIYQCCQCIGCHQGLSPNAIAPAIAGLRFGKRSSHKTDKQTVVPNPDSSSSRGSLPRRWILSSVLY